MKRKLTALLAALCITAVLPVHAGAVYLLHFERKQQYQEECI